MAATTARAPSGAFVGLMDGALALARGGIPVISLRPRSKVPMHAGWPELGMLDEDAIRLEWKLNPEANVGVLCGRDAFAGTGLTIVDIDQPDGPRTLTALEAEHGPLPDAAPLVSTPSGGRHRYFRGHATSWNPGAGLEVRSTGRQCAAPPSAIGSRPYAWFTDPLGRELPELPGCWPGASESRGRLARSPRPAWLIRCSRSRRPSTSPSCAPWCRTATGSWRARSTRSTSPR